MRTTILLLSVVLMTAAGLAQTPVPPPPKPPDSGPSLEVTLKFIQEKISDQGKLYWAANYHDSATGKDWISQISVEQKLSGEASACKINFHYSDAADGKAVHDLDSGFSLRDVQDLSVMPWDQLAQRYFADTGHPTYSGTSTPPVFSLKLRLPKGHWLGFHFKEEETANRVAKAMVHAVELCGGGSKPEPF